MYPTLAEWAAEIQAGNRVALGRAITLVESQLPAHRAQAVELLANLKPNLQTIRLGITGIPGVGKSSFIEAFGTLLIQKGYRVAVLAVDPSSQRSGGSILGDKVRMGKLSQSDQAFIRPTPSSGAMGGIAPQTREVIELCEAAGFDFILIETVGVGQSETEVAQLCDIFVLLMLAGAGDEVQGIKRGIMELADFILVNKCDGENESKAEQARLVFQRALHFFEHTRKGIIAQAFAVSALTGKGILDFFDQVLAFRAQQEKSGAWEANRVQQAVFWFRTLVKRRWEQLLYEQFSQEMQQAEVQIQNGANVVAITTALFQPIQSTFKSESK